MSTMPTSDTDTTSCVNWGGWVSVTNCTSIANDWRDDFTESLREISRAVARALDAAARLLAIRPHCPDPILGTAKVFVFMPMRHARSSPPRRFAFYQGDF